MQTAGGKGFGFLPSQQPPFKVRTTKYGQGFTSTNAGTSLTCRSDLSDEDMQKNKQKLKRIKDQMAMKTESRRDQWVEQFRTNPKALNSLMSGSQDTAHPTMFSFRDKSERANIYVRSYMTSSDRASLK